MLRHFSGQALLLLCLACLVSAQPATVPIAPIGTWKVILPVLGDETQASWLVRFDRAGETWNGTIIATAEGVPTAKVEEVRHQGDTLNFTLKTSSLTLPATLKIGKTGELRLKGEVIARGKSSPIILEATKMTALDDFALAEEVLTRPDNNRETYRAALTLLALAGPRKATLQQVDTWAKRAAKSAETFGAEQRDALITLATYLAEKDITAFLAVDYAEKAEKLVGENDPPIVRKRVLRVLAIALERSGKKTEAQAVRSRNDAIEILRLRPYTGKAKSVVLVENYTSVQQAKCLATDLAVEGLERTYPNGEVVILCSHLSLGGPDPLANPATEEQSRYYRPTSLPAVFLNGRPLALTGGTLDDAQARYEALVTGINPLLDRVAAGTPLVAPALNQPPVPMPPKVDLKATSLGDRIDVQVEVSNLVKPNANLRLRLAIVEEVVEYLGANGLPRHRNVVRDYIGSPAGIALTEKTSNKRFTVDVPELRKKLQASLEKTNQATPFPGRTWPTELKKLRLVGYLQNDESREVLAAVMVNVTE